MRPIVDFHSGVRLPPLRALAAGFTLLEILVVLVIIGLLAGLVGPRLLSQLDRAKVTTAETQIRMLKGAIETMRLDIGRFPNAQEGLNLLTVPPQDPALRQRWRGPYLDGQLPLDPWGHPYQYDPRGKDNNPFALYSFGAEGRPGGTGENAPIGMLPAN
jgi:general secretion pathway protein G